MPSLAGPGTSTWLPAACERSDPRAHSLPAATNSAKFADSAHGREPARTTCNSVNVHADLKRRPQPHLFSIGVAVLLLAGCLAWTRSGTIDDAYISFRYAVNLTHGHGLVFNPGQRVEGESNPLWVLLLAAAQTAHLPLPAASYLLGVLCLLATISITHVLSIRLGLSPLIAGVTTATAALSTDLVAGATMGLEGGLYAALLLAVVVLWNAEGLANAWLVLAILGLATTRPEGIVIGTVLSLARLFRSFAGRWSPRLAGSTAALGGIALLELTRHWYYGSWAPTSVTAKRDIGYSPLSSAVYHMPGGAVYLLSRGGAPLVLAALSALLAATALRRSYTEGQKRTALSPLVWPASLTLILGLLLPLLSGGDWMPYARLLTPYLPLAAVLSVYLVKTTSATHLAPALPVVMLLLGGHSLPLRDGGRNPLWSDRGQDSVGRALEQLGSQRVIATDVLGRVAFWSPDRNYTDIYGLTEPAVANSPGRGSVFGKSNYAVTLAARPGVIDTNDWPRLPQILATPTSKPNYQAVVSRKLTHDRAFLLVDPAVSDAVLRALRAAGFPDATTEPVAAATATWAAAAPNGQ